MTEIEATAIEEKTNPITEKKGSITINIRDLYNFKPEDLNIDISEEHYSNLAYMQVTHRDVHIDFLSMPGVKKDGKMTVNGIRVFMSHVAAQKLAEALGQLLEDAHYKGDMETYTKGRTKKPTTKVSRTVKEKMA